MATRERRPVSTPRRERWSRSPAPSRAGERPMSHIRFGAHARLAAAFMVGIVALAGLRSAALAQDRVVRFGASLSLTGSLSDNGRLVKDGYDFYAKHINQQFGGIEMAGAKYRVEIKYHDDQSNPTTATRLVEKLITEDDIKFI